MWIHRARPRRPDDGGEGTGAEGAGAAAASGAAGAASTAASAGSAAGDKSAATGTTGATGAAGDGKAAATEPTWRADWREQLAGDDDKTLKQLQRYASPAEVWKKAKGLEERVSSGELRAALPKGATAEQITEWRKANGVPEKAEGYDLGAASGKFSDETKAFLDKILPSLHGANLSNDQARSVLKALNDYTLEGKATRAQSDVDAQDAGEETLRAEWGTEYPRNVNIIKNLLDKNADAKFKDAVLNARDGETGKPLSSDPRWLKLLLGVALIDNPAGKLVPNGGANPMKGVEDRIAEIEKLMGTKTYTNDEKMQAEYRELIDVRDKLKARA